MLSLGPLIASFSPPSGCLSPSTTWILYDQVGASSYFLQGQTSTASCFPANYDPHTTAFYSPGFCPSGYTPVGAREGKPLSTDGTQTCCPTYASFEARNTSQNNLFMSTMACQSFFGLAGLLVATQMSGSETVTTTTTYQASDVLNAYGVIVVPATSTSTAQASTTGLATQTSSITTATSTSPPSQSASSHGLSTSAKAGIGGGIAGGVLLLALGGGLGFVIYRRGKWCPRTDIGNTPPQYGDKAGVVPAHEVNPSHAELATGRNMSELSTGRDAQELPT
ncbi:hypothetical protein BDV96DRAFT_583181 [Lophiotrema nucula]|uniref:Uncharacterized protein n=1 Tax=Lophiotrema nucula TaxID=690887 RepID=A0A6A5YXV7_9PLEO|nr:hypothetical protein BDV96DRAFT_583181 [Lophiotrema nucula]